MPAQRYVRLEDAIDRVARPLLAENPPGAPPEPPPEIPTAITQFQELQSEGHHAQHVICYWQHKEMLWAQQHKEMLAFQQRIRCQEAAKGKIFAKLYADELKLLLCSAEDPHAAPKLVLLSFVHQFRNLDELVRALDSPRDPRRRIRDIGPSPLLLIDNAIDALADTATADGATVALVEPAQPVAITPPPAYTEKQVAKVRAWLLTLPEFFDKSRGDPWRQLIVTKAKTAPEVQGIKVTTPLLKYLIRHDPSLRKRL